MAMIEEVVVDTSVTIGQISCFIAYCALVGIWICSEYSAKAHSASVKPGDHPHSSHVELVTHGGKDAKVEIKDESHPAALHHAGGQQHSFTTSPFLQCLALDDEALVVCRPGLRAGVEMGTIMLWFYIVDRTALFASAEKSYIRDLFLFLFLALTIVAGAYTRVAWRTPVLLNRKQTEEWKGWMQTLFLLYHYYAATEVYNAIRVFIASYVWMTGFGNFAYYYKTSDFSMGRFCQMMWRLNFLCVLCCLVLNNSIMLYYICPMHTLFTIFVYAALGIGKQYNHTTSGIIAKIVACFVLVYLTFDLENVFYAIWSPLSFMLGYSDPRRPVEDTMHEWFFRASLDRYIWIYGMICAYMHPTAEKALKALDELPAFSRRLGRAFLAAAAVGIGIVWYHKVYLLPKLEYNKVHPFTSWIPITVYMVLRNLMPPMRIWSMGLYGWLGCITLETYISQYHVWMVTKIPDGQPVFLLSLLPGYPLLNFAIISAAYIFISFRLFTLTAALRDAMIPHDNDRLLLRNSVHMALGTGAVLLSGFVVSQVLAFGGLL